MSDFTFLTKEQIFGINPIEVIQKRKSKAKPTDFTVILGARTSDQLSNKKDTLNKRTSSYWTRSDIGKLGVTTVNFEGTQDYDDKEERYVGARLSVPCSSVIDMSYKMDSLNKAADGIIEINLGEYPQNAAPKEIQEILEDELSNYRLQETGRKYTADSAKFCDSSTSFKPRIFKEYIFQNRKYIRVRTMIQGSGIYLLNGEKYADGDSVWIEVEPVKWLADKELKLMVSEKILFSGVQFNSKEDIKNRFEVSNIKRFIDNNFVRELLQSAQRTGPYQKESFKPYKSDEFEERHNWNEDNTNINNIENIKDEIEQKENNKKSNPYALEFDEVSETDIIKAALESNVSIFLHGKPGCGKSDRVKQLDPDFIELNLSHLDPELLDGLAGEKDGKAVHIKPPWLEELEDKCINENDKIHILFLEELTNASPMMQSKAYGIALDKKVAGRWKLPENARVVAAGNELEDSLVANEIAEPLYDRFAHVNIETTVESWLEWAVTPESFYERIDYKKQDETRPKIHPAVYGFISYQGDRVLRTNYDRENPKPHADPRRWKMASDMLYASNNPQTLVSILGEDITEEFISFCKTTVITIEDILNENYTDEDIRMDLGTKIATVSGLVRVDDENMEKVREFVKELGPEMCKKFEVQWSGGNEERLEQLQEIHLKEQEEIQEDKKEELKDNDNNNSNIDIQNESKMNIDGTNDVKKDYLKNRKSGIVFGVDIAEERERKRERERNKTQYGNKSRTSEEISSLKNTIDEIRRMEMEIQNIEENKNNKNNNEKNIKNRFKEFF